MAVEWAKVADRFTDWRAWGSLPGILVLDAEAHDWRVLYDVIRDRSDWQPTYTEDHDPRDFPADLSHAFDRSREASVTIELHPAQDMVVIGFFQDYGEIEFDVNSGSVNSQDRLDGLIELLTTFGRAIGKRVIVTPEGGTGSPFLAYEPDRDDVVTFDS